MSAIKPIQLIATDNARSDLSVAATRLIDIFNLPLHETLYKCSAVDALAFVALSSDPWGLPYLLRKLSWLVD